MSEPDGAGSSEIAHERGLLHDARNLMGALGLYSDLLSVPGVLKREHRHYAEELRLVGRRSNALIERLMSSSLWPEWAQDHRAGSAAEPATGAGPAVYPVTPARPVSLRTIVEGSSGLLSQVAGGRAIEVSYGAAAAAPVLVSEEAIERILVNLVCNAGAALNRRAVAGAPAAHPDQVCANDPGQGVAGDRAATDCISLKETFADGTEDETPGAIRIGVGLLVNRVDDPRPWPFRRVRLTVEDSGCGMTPEQLERVLWGGRAPSRGGHGIGLRVVRDLVSASGGDLRAMSAQGVGTRVQIEWPMAGLALEHGTESSRRPGAGARRSEDATANAARSMPC